MIFENWHSVFFEAVEGGTRAALAIHVRSATKEAGKNLKGMAEGWSQSLDKLSDLLTHP